LIPSGVRSKKCGAAFTRITRTPKFCAKAPSGRGGTRSRLCSGRIGTLGGAPYDLSPHVVAGTPKVYEALLDILGPHVPESLKR